MAQALKKTYLYQAGGLSDNGAESALFAALSLLPRPRLAFSLIADSCPTEINDWTMMSEPDRGSARLFTFNARVKLIGPNLSAAARREPSRFAMRRAT